MGERTPGGSFADLVLGAYKGVELGLKGWQVTGNTSTSTSNEEFLRES
jgi:hypothetical protein